MVGKGEEVWLNQTFKSLETHTVQDDVLKENTAFTHNVFC